MKSFLCQFRAMIEHFRTAYHTGDYGIAEYKQLLTPVEELETVLRRRVHAQHQRRLIDLKYRLDEEVVREAERALDDLGPPRGAA